jgi:adenosylcobinamide-phosphate synthase
MGRLTAGVAIAFAVPVSCTVGCVLLLEATRPWPLLSFLAAVFLLKSSFSLRELGRAARRVRGALARDDLSEARYGLCSLCSRESGQLGERQLVGATVSSLAENTSDSFVAPLLYYATFGVPGAVAYRAVNTLDSMIGYRGHYENLGKAAARLDDLLNLLPARLTSLLLIAAGAVQGLPARVGWRMMRRDGHRTPSPNGGRPMAAMAGLLGVVLEKDGCYRLGDDRERLTPATIDWAWRLVSTAAAVATLLAGAAVGIRYACFQ